MFFVYIIYSGKYNRTYTGLTNNLDRRLREHNNRQSRSTKAFCPWKLIHFERFEIREDARKREKYFKSGSGREFIKKHILKMAQ